MDESTHIYFDGQKIIISPDVGVVFQFLIHIEEELNSVLNFNRKIADLREDFSDLFKLISSLGHKLQENNIDFEYTLREHPEKIPEKLKTYLPVRSQMIVLFSSLEVLFSLHMAYELETSDKVSLRAATMNSGNTKSFLSNYVLTQENSFYASDARYKKIDSRKLRDLRNSLTHFFSVGSSGLSVAPHVMTEDSRKLESELKEANMGHVVFLSEQDLYGLIKGANLLRLKRWSDDFQKNRQDFKRKMSFVIELVNSEAAVLITKGSQT